MKCSYLCGNVLKIRIILLRDIGISCSVQWRSSPPSHHSLPNQSHKNLPITILQIWIQCSKYVLMVSENNKCHNLCFEQFPKCVLDILISMGRHWLWSNTMLSTQYLCVKIFGNNRVACAVCNAYFKEFEVGGD